MGTIQLELVKVSFRRGHPDWRGEIELDLHEKDSICVLVGKNAGGKSLALKAIKKFTDLLIDPTDSTKQEFEKLVNLTGITDMRATYRGSISHVRGGRDGVADIKDPDKAISLSGFGDDDGQIRCDIASWDIYVETLFKKKRRGAEADKISYRRRYVDEIFLNWYANDREDESGITVSWDTKETGPHCSNPKWFEIFESQPEIDRMAYLGEDSNWLKKKLGISIPEWYDDHHWWDRKKNWHFVPDRTHFLIVDQAYNISRETIDRLMPFNKYSKLNQTNKKWINKRLHAAFLMTREKAKLQFDRYASYINSRSDKKSKGAFKILNMKEEKLIQKIFYFKLVYPNAKLFSDSETEYNFRSVFHASWIRENALMAGLIVRMYTENFEIGDPRLTAKFHEFEPPTCSTVFDPEQFHNCEKRQPPENLKDLYSTLVPQCGEMIRENDPDWWFWILVSDFLDYPEYSETTYYSSGQRRLIAILETIDALDQNSVILLDEPELSLHIDWQRKFISKIGKGKKMILATHSPDIIYNHVEKVIEVPPNKGV